MPRRSRRYMRLIALPLVSLLSLACAFFGQPLTPGTPTELGTATAPAAPSDTPRPPASATAPTADATTTPGRVPVEPTDTSAPPVTGLNPAGPYVLFRSPEGLYLTNPDGSFQKQVSALVSSGDLRRSLSPRGDRLALVETEAGLDLVLVSLPDGASKTVAQLSTLTLDEEIQDALAPAAFAKYAIRDYDSLAWQPGEGRYLAFVGAINGPTADLYLFDTQDQSIRQLTDGPSQAVLPEWSPDGQYILHGGVSWVPPFGGAILGANQLDGVWAVRVADGALVELPKPQGFGPNLVGWLDDNYYLTFDRDPDCGTTNLRGVAVANGTVAPLLDVSFYDFLAQSPENGALMFSSAPADELPAGCLPSLGEGVFLFFPGQSIPVQLDDQRAFGVEWLPESRVFQAYPEALYSADGQTRYDPPVLEASFNPAVSAAGDEAWEVIENQQGRVEIRSPGGDWQTYLTGPVAYQLWDPLGQRTLLVALQDGSLYSLAYPDFTPRLMGNLGGRVNQAIWVP